MINLKDGLTYKEFLMGVSSENLEMIEKHEEREKIITNSKLEKLKNMEGIRNIAVFSIQRCEDAATTIPILHKLAKLNKNINIKFFNRDDNEELLEKLVGEKKVPTIVIMNENNEVISKYIEFPSVVKEKIYGKSEEEKKAIVKEFRNGKYNEEMQNELIELIVK